jgi:serine/threonine protein kinase
MGRRRGAGKIGEGMSGRVYYPALECDDPSKQPKGDYVSKVMKPDAARAEFTKTEPLRKLGPSYAIYPEAMCARKGNSMLFSKFGGFNLADYFTNLEQVYEGALDWAPEPVPVNKDELNSIVRGLQELSGEIDEMNRAGLYHNDVSMDNIVFNPSTKKVYLIDFERMTLTPPKGRSDKDNILDIFKSFKAYADKELKSKS